MSNPPATVIPAAEFLEMVETHLSPKLRDSASCLVNAGADDTQRRLAAMTGTADDIADLQAAIAHERAKPKLSQRISRLKPMEAKLRKFVGPTPGKSETVAAVAPAAILSSAVKSMDKFRLALGKQEDAFWAATLGARLQIGLQCLKAYQVFVIRDPKKTGAMKGKKAVTRDGLPEGGFEGWLAAEAEWLKKPTAYKYMTAVRGLGLDHGATEKQVAAALKLLLRKGPVNLAGLYAAAVDKIADKKGEGNGGGATQTEFEFLRDGLADFRKQADALLALKTQLHENPDMERVASARVYGLLYELTGTHWTPSDEPDALASVNPDSIEL